MDFLVNEKGGAWSEAALLPFSLTTSMAMDAIQSVKSATYIILEKFHYIQDHKPHQMWCPTLAWSEDVLFV